jgi:hypothetical protein
MQLKKVLLGILALAAPIFALSATNATLYSRQGREAWNDQVRRMPDWNDKEILNSMQCWHHSGRDNEVTWEIKAVGKWLKADGGRAFYRSLKNHCAEAIGYLIDTDENGKQTVFFDLAPGANKDRSTCVKDAFLSIAYFVDGLLHRWETENCADPSQLEFLTKEQLDQYMFNEYQDPGREGPLGLSKRGAMSPSAINAIMGYNATRDFDDPMDLRSDPMKLNAPPMSPVEVAIPFGEAQGVICAKSQEAFAKVFESSRWTVLGWGAWFAADWGQGFLDNLRADCWQYMVRNWGFDYDFLPGAPYAVGRAEFNLEVPIIDSVPGLRITPHTQNGECIKRAALKASEAFGPFFYKCDPFGLDLGEDPALPDGWTK